MKKNILIALVCFSTTIFPESVSEQIADINIRQYSWNEDDWDEPDYKNFLLHYLSSRLKPSDRFKYTMAFELLKSVEALEDGHKKTILYDTVTWQDLDLFLGKQKRNHYVARCVNRSRLTFSEVYFMYLLAHPQDDIAFLQKRQSIIAHMLNDRGTQAAITDALNVLQKHENGFLAAWRKDHFKHGTDRCYFSLPGFKALNNNAELLQLRSLFEHSQRLWWAGNTMFAAAVLLGYTTLSCLKPELQNERLTSLSERFTYGSGPFFVLLSMLKNPWVQKTTALMAGVFALLGLKHDVEWAQACLVLEEVIHRLMIESAQYLRAMRHLYQTVRTVPLLYHHEEFKPLIMLFEDACVQDPELQELFSLIDRATFDNDAVGISAHKGSVLRMFRLLHGNKNKLEPALVSVALLDIYCGLSDWYTEHAGSHAPACLVNFNDSPVIALDLKDFWHPMVNRETVVANSLALMGQDRPNIVITGPNAGGKSTILKSIALAIILAQTFGVAPARAMTLTPMSILATYLNITDDIGVGNSLFKQEVIRTQELMQKVAQNPQQKSFIVFDEIFNGTSPVEGEAAAYAVAKHFGTFANTICCVATHFALLTKLESNTPFYKNYHVSVDKAPDGIIRYPYTLSLGVTNQHVALEILKQEGFALPILEEAQKIVESRTSAAA